MRNITHLVVHCSATPPTMNVDVAQIDAWHKAQGWAGCGYHWVVKRDGTVQAGRPEAQAGAHVAGHNANSIGVCLAGGTDAKGKPQNNFTPEQFASLEKLLRELVAKYPRARILGHKDFPGVAKACPSFEIKTWSQERGLPT